MGDAEKSLQERVQQVRRWESQRELFNRLPTFNQATFCLCCREITDHLALGFDEVVDWPLLIFCNVCSHFEIDRLSMTTRERVKQIRQWAKWARETGGPGPTEAWLFLLPGLPREKTHVHVGA